VLKVGVILGSTRKTRFADKPGRWIYEKCAQRPGFTAECIDLCNFNLPFFDEPVSPGWASEPYPNEAVVRWTKKVWAQDAYIMVAPEYNRSLTAVVKNAFDWVYREWGRKPIGFVSYGSVGGARAVEHMRLIAVELQMAPMRSAVHITGDLFQNLMKMPPPVDLSHFAPLENAAASMLDQLEWWGTLLKEGREKRPL